MICNHIDVRPKKELGAVSSLVEQVIPHLNVYLLTKAPSTRIQYARVMQRFLLDFNENLLVDTNKEIRNKLITIQRETQNVTSLRNTNKMRVLK